jgi:hypothetical protein
MARILDHHPQLILDRKLESGSNIIRPCYIDRVRDIVPRLARPRQRREGIACLVLIPREAELARKREAAITTISLDSLPLAVNKTALLPPSLLAKKTKKNLASYCACAKFHPALSSAHLDALNRPSYRPPTWQALATGTVAMRRPPTVRLSRAHASSSGQPGSPGRRLQFGAAAAAPLNVARTPRRMGIGFMAELCVGIPCEPLELPLSQLT